MRLHLLVFLVSMGCFGCEATRQAKLQESVDAFYTALRREDNARAIAYVDPESKTKFFENLESIHGLQISNLQVDTVFPDEKLDSALVTVNLEYFTPGSSELRSSKRYYSWAYKSEADAWCVEEDHPFGRSSTRQKGISSSIAGP